MTLILTFGLDRVLVNVNLQLFSADVRAIMLPYSSLSLELGDTDLVKLQLHKDEWQVRHARRILQERAHDGKLSGTVAPALREMLRGQKEPARKLRALWALYAVGGLDEKALGALLGSPEEDVRRWAVRLLVDDHPVSDATAARLAEMEAHYARNRAAELDDLAYRRARGKNLLSMTKRLS